MDKGIRLSSRKLEVRDDPEAILRKSCDEGWGDGFPLIPPTEERVAEMVGYTGRDPGEVIAKLPPLGGDATVEKIAINAVMAGCIPEHLPVVIAAVDAMAAPKFNLHGVQTTTNSVGPALIINGPVRNKLNINCKTGCLGPGWRANATIGRAVRLILLNIGGAVPDAVDKAMHGYPGKYTFCFGEDEEKSAWEPLHVERGFDRASSAVTVIGAAATINVAAVTANWRTWIDYTAAAVSVKGNLDMFWGRRNEPVVVLTAAHTQVLAKEGITKARFKEMVFDKAGMPESEVPADFKAEIIAIADYLAIGGKVLPCTDPDKILIVVAGGPMPYHITVIPTTGFAGAVTKQVFEQGAPNKTPPS